MSKVFIIRSKFSEKLNYNEVIIILIIIAMKKNKIRVKKLTI